MAHLIENMVSAGGMTPWHKLGTVVQDKALTADDALRLGGLDWTVRKVPLVTSGEMIGGQFQMFEVPDQFAMVRSNDNSVLGVVGSRYTPFQNYEAFEFFDQIVSRKEAIYDTAGSLDGGRKVWILAKLPGEIRVLGEDLTNKYVLLSNSHDGSGTVQVKITPIRVVCNNTLTAALRGKGFSHSIRHTEGVVNAVREAAEVMGFTNKMYDELNEAFNAFAGVKLNGKKADDYLLKVLKAAKQTEKVKDTDGEDDEEEEKTPRAFGKIKELMETGKGTDLPGVKGSLWGVYNAVTEYVDHKKYRNDNSRLDSVWFNGSGQKLKSAAMKEAMAMLK